MDNIERWKNQRGTDFTIVLNDSLEGLILNNTRHVYKSLMTAELPLVYLAVIFHDKDMIDDKTMKTPHYHIVMQLSRSIRIGTIVNVLQSVFVGLSENMISLDKCTSLSAQSRYLIHLDDIDKYHYDASDVMTNDYDVFKSFLDEIPTIKNVKDIINVCYHFNFDIEKIMIALGKDNYKTWRLFIMDIRKSKGLY